MPPAERVEKDFWRIVEDRIGTEKSILANGEVGAFARGSGYQTGVGAVVGEKVDAHSRGQEDSEVASGKKRFGVALHWQS